MNRAQSWFTFAAMTKIDTSTWLGMSVSLRGRDAAVELELLELELLLAPPGASPRSRSSFSAKRSLKSAIVAAFFFVASVQLGFFLFSC